jgi:hypothetical protein
MSFPCPKCNRILVRSGMVVVSGRELPTFQCDKCVMTVEFMGDKMEVALTFTLDENGKPFDPEAPDGKLRLDG